MSVAVTCLPVLPRRTASDVVSGVWAGVGGILGSHDGAPLMCQSHIPVGLFSMLVCLGFCVRMVRTLMESCRWFAKER